MKLTFLDGYEGVVDLRPVIAKGKIFAWLQKPDAFNNFRLDDYGHSISWIDDQGSDISLSAEGLRRDCERQAEIHKLMVS